MGEKETRDSLEEEAPGLPPWHLAHSRSIASDSLTPPPAPWKQVHPVLTFEHLVSNVVLGIP